MWSFRDGLRVLIDTLAARLPSPPQLGVTVRRVERTERGWLVRGEGSDSWPAAAVVLACPAYQQAALLDDLDGELADQVAAIPYNRLAVVALGYRAADLPAPLDGFGFLVPKREGRDLLGVQWCSSIYPDRAPDGAVLLRAMCGGWHRPETVGWDDDRLLAAVRADLRLTMNLSAAPVFHEIIRWDRAIPQYHVGHLDRLAWIDHRLPSHPGLFLAGNAYRGVALNDCAEQGEAVARQVGDYLASVS
jgi:oxygen-dependent protoporphyrinogen oxidase